MATRFSEERKRFGERLSTLVKSSELGLDTISKDMGISTEILIKSMAGEHYPSYAELASMRKYFGVKYEDLMDAIPEPKTSDTFTPGITVSPEAELSLRIYCMENGEGKLRQV